MNKKELIEELENMHEDYCTVRYPKFVKACVMPLVRQLDEPKECVICESDSANVYKNNIIKWFTCSNCKCDFLIDMTDINSPNGFCQCCGAKISRT